MEQLNALVVIPVEERHKEYLAQQAAGGKAEVNFTYVPAKNVTAEDVSAADIIIGNVPGKLIGANPKLRWMQLNSAGADAYSPAGILAESTILTNSAGAYGTSVSEHMLAMTMTLIRHFEKYGRQQVKHEWRTVGKVTSIKGSTILVLGLGDIGGRYAKSCAALGAHVIGVRRTLHTEKPDYLEEQHTIDELDELLPRADIVAMVLPGGAATEKIMDERRLRLMKKGAYIINDGRGTAIDLKALRKVLDEGLLGGAGLDVTDPEPLPADDPLWDYENVFITPHIAGQFLLQETFENIVEIAGENLHAFVNDEPLTHVVNRSVGY